MRLTYAGSVKPSGQSGKSARFSLARFQMVKAERVMSNLRSVFVVLAS